MMLRAAMQIKESAFLSSSMGGKNVSMSSCDISVGELSSSSESYEEETPNLAESIRATCEYYAGGEKTLSHYQEGPETLRKAFIATTFAKIKKHQWTEESVRLLEAVHWSEHLTFKDIKAVKKNNPVSLSYAIIGKPQLEDAKKCCTVTVTRNTAYEWWNEYSLWKKYNSDARKEFFLQDPGTHDEYRERFLASGKDQEGNSCLTKVLREEKGAIVEKYVYVEESFFVQKKLQARLVAALFEVFNFIPRIVSRSKDWINSTPQERDIFIERETKYFTDIVEMSELMHLAHKSEIATEGDKGAVKKGRQSAFNFFCQEKIGGENISADEKKTLGAKWRKLTDAEKQKYGRKKNATVLADQNEGAQHEKKRKLDQENSCSPVVQDKTSEPPTPIVANKQEKAKDVSKGVLVGRSLESVVEELHTFFNSNLFKDANKKFTWNLFHANMKAAQKKGKTTNFNETCFKNAFDAMQTDESPAKILKLISAEEKGIKASVQTFNILFSRPAVIQRDEIDEFII